MSNHHAKEIQEMRTIQKVHTRTLNEMHQQLTTLVQRHGGSDQGGLPQSPTIDHSANFEQDASTINYSANF